jgi:TolA-binding protein
MSSSVARRRQPSRTPRPSQGSGWRRPVIWSVLIVTTLWSIAAAAYFALRKDDTQQMAEMQAGYEKRVADLRTEFDRTTNQQLLDQKRIQQQFDELERTRGGRAACCGAASGYASRETSECSPPSRNARETTGSEATATCWTAARAGSCTGGRRRARLCA